MATGRWARRATCGALAIWLLAGCGGRLARTPDPAVAPAVRQTTITDIQVGGDGDAVTITITTDAKAAYSLVRQLSPPRLLLELAGTGTGVYSGPLAINRGAVSLLKAETAGPNSRLEILLSSEATYDIEGQGNAIVLSVAPKPPLAASVTTEIVDAGEAGKVAAAEAAPTEPPSTFFEAPAQVAPPAPVAEVAPAPVVVFVEEAAPVPKGPRVLTAIDVKKSADGLVVTLQGNGPLSFEYFLVEGRSLVVDIADATNKVWPMKKRVDDAWVSQIRLGEHLQPKKATRVVFDLKKVGEYRVAGAGNGIVVSFGAPALAAVAAAGTVSLSNTVGEVSYQPLAGATRLEIPTAVKADFSIVDSGDPAKVIIEIANARIPEQYRKTLDLASSDREVVKISAFPYTRGDAQLVRVVAQLRRPVPFRAVAENDRVLVDFERVAAPSAAIAVAAAPAAPALGSTEPPVIIAETDPAPAFRVYTGRKLSLDFKDADVNDILRLISEVSGLNFVAGPEVKGTVTIKLADVPWDQALDIILKTNQPQLAQIRESDTIVRITTSDKILDEEQRRRRIEEDKKKTIDAAQALEPLVTKSYSISYADKMESLKTIVEGFKSDRGRIQIDERTKTLLVQDVAARIAEIDAVVLTLDTPTPAVLVEARIVEMTSGYEQQLGVQWGANFVADAQHGNATDWAFPNSVKVGGTQASGANNYMVNLPAAAASSGLGFSFGHIANTLSLDLRLSAMEKMGRTKILSNPKVLVVQNQKAVINVGSQLPIPKTNAEGERTVDWKDVGIKLEVLPQVTNDRRIFMNIQIEKSDRGENVQTTEGSMFSIVTSRADTKVLIADGETTVIGGIFVQETFRDDSSVPGLSKLPLLGWLFKSKADREARRELMIFLTPRLVTI